MQDKYFEDCVYATKIAIFRIFLFTIYHGFRTSFIFLNESSLRWFLAVVLDASKHKFPVVRKVNVVGG